MDSFNLENRPRLKAGFKVPDDYFDGLEDRIMAKIQKPEPKVIPLFARYRKAIYAAAAVLVIAFMVRLFNMLDRPSETIDEAALEHYLAYESGLSQFDLLTAMEPEDISNLQQQYVLSIPDEELEEALSASNLEYILTE